MKSDTGLSTRCVHAGEIQDAQGSPHTPLYTTTTFKFKSTADLLDVVEEHKTGNLYARYGSNPTIRALKDKLAALEGTEADMVVWSWHVSVGREKLVWPQSRNLERAGLERNHARLNSIVTRREESSSALIACGSASDK